MDVLEILHDEGVSFECSQHPVTYTAQQLAAVEHVPGRCVAKPVLLFADGEYILSVIPAPNRVDLSRVVDVLMASEVRLAGEDEMASVFNGCELGAEPPIGPLFGLKTLVDYTLMEEDSLIFQAGSHTRCVRISRVDFERITDPSYGDIIETL